MDVNLKVYGTANVRVVRTVTRGLYHLSNFLFWQVDASVIPLHMGTHISRTVYGIAEKAASIIKSGN